MEPASTGVPTRAAAWRGLAALATAGALALRVTGSLVDAERPDPEGPPGSRRPSRDAVAIVEQALGPIPAAVHSGDRIALLVHDDDLDGRFLIQYVLVPAILFPVRSDACFGRPDPQQCVRDATHVLVPGVPPAQAAAFGERLGFVPVASGPRATLLARRPR